jgi:hypothetical protein
MGGKKQMKTEIIEKNKAKWFKVIQKLEKQGYFDSNYFCFDEGECSFSERNLQQMFRSIEGKGDYFVLMCSGHIFSFFYKFNYELLKYMKIYLCLNNNIENGCAYLFAVSDEDCMIMEKYYLAKFYSMSYVDYNKRKKDTE